MGKVRIGGGLIVLEDIGDDPALRRRLEAVSAVETIELMIGGERSHWESLVTKRDGRLVAAIRPVEGQLYAPAAQIVEIALAPRDGGLAMFGLRLQMWDTTDNQIH